VEREVDENEFDLMDFLGRTKIDDVEDETTEDDDDVDNVSYDD